MIKVKECLPLDKGFFTTLNEVNPTLYTSLFDLLQPVNLDVELITSCGERYASPILTSFPLSQVVTCVLARYGDNWLKVKNALIADYDVLNQNNRRQVRTMERNTENVLSGTVVDNTSIPTFDESIVTKNSDSTQNDTSETNNESVTTTIETHGNTNISLSNLVANEIEVRKNSFIKLVVGDVKNQLTLDIY